MKRLNIFFEWEPDEFSHRYGTAVSLHSHSLHSRESLSFVYRAATKFPPLRAVLNRGEERYRRNKGRQLDLSRAWWTPPLTALDAWKLERRQIENHLGMNAFVSLSDHDDIEGPSGLQLIEDCRGTPISVEWTVPFSQTFLHLGVHNLPPGRAREFMDAMSQYTARPVEKHLGELLDSLARCPEVLIVFNHPCWDELAIGATAHRRAVSDFIAAYRPLIHALELNGLRPWRENREVIDLAAATPLPLISGGDRHGLEPNAVLNLTNAATFPEFVDEVRNERWSDVLLMSHYRENFAWRIVQNIADVLDTYEDHGLGWKHWSDRVFYQFEDTRVESLKQLWKNGAPPAVRVFVGAMHLVSAPRMKFALRAAFARREQVVL